MDNQEKESEMMKKIYLTILIVIIFISLISHLVLADTPYCGSLHQHTGYSTIYGYNGIFQAGFGDDCFPYTLEGHTIGYTVEELKEDALDKNLDWLAFSDHSYCIDTTEFNTVRDNCDAEDNARADFACLMGEEISTQDISGDGETTLEFFGLCEN